VVTVLALLGVVLVLFVAAVVATREDQAMADAAQDLPDLALPVGPLEPQDVAAVRFSMAPRGYRMSEVDAVLERLAAELADRDRQLAELQGPHLLDEDLLDEDEAVAGER
jgi:DivIVA domain-containing protein